MAHLLLVEDNDHMRRIYVDKFRSEGFDVATAADGEQGLAAARVAPPDAILLDLMMPKLNGFDFLKQIRTESGLDHIPVFVLSNKSWPDDINHALSLGARHFYSKGSHTLQEITRQLRLECGLKKIIIVTRDAAAAASLRASLEHPRLLCGVSTMFVEACTLAERGAPDVIVLDARAGANVPGLLQQLKTAAATRMVPVVAISDQPQSLPRADAVIPVNAIATQLRRAVLERVGLPEA